MTDRVDGRRIDNFRTEVAKFRSLHITQFADGIGGGDHTGIGRHKAIYIRPDFQAVGVQCRSDNRRRIVGTASSQIRDFPRHLVR